MCLNSVEKIKNLLRFNQMIKSSFREIAETVMQHLACFTFDFVLAGRENLSRAGIFSMIISLKAGFNQLQTLTDSK